MTTEQPVQYTADAVILAPGPAVLLIQRRWNPYEGRWALPGGCVDPGETDHRDTAARELAEETGIILPPSTLRKVSTYTTPGRDPRGDYRTTAYATTVLIEITPTAADDAAAARWWPVRALPQLAFDHDEILADALALFGLN